MIKGLDKIQANLSREVKRIKNISSESLVDIAIHVRRDMDEKPPLIPVDTGNLRNSWTANLTKGVKGSSMTMGFTANYAAAVHELMDGDGVNWSRPGSGAKFFEAALKRNKLVILKIIQGKAKIK